MTELLTEMKSALLVLTYLSIPMTDEERMKNFIEIIEKQSVRMNVRPKTLIGQYEKLNNEMYGDRTDFFKQARKQVKSNASKWQ